MVDVAPRQLTATFTPVNGITQKVTKDEVLVKLAQKEEEAVMTQQDEVLLKLLKEKGITLESLLSAVPAPASSTPSLTPGQRIGQGVGKLLRISKLAVQVAKVQGKAFVTDVKKGYQESK